MKAVFALTLAALLAFAAAQSRCPVYEVNTVRAVGRRARDLRRTVNRFNRILGDPDNGSLPGPQEIGRRSINWDNPALPFILPGDFFNTVAPRGLVMRTKGGQFRVSNSEDPADDRFDSILPRSVSTQFQTFSSPRLFSPLLSNVFTGIFRIPGRNKAGPVTGFGAIFVDVDAEDETYIEYFDKQGCLIDRVFARRGNRGLSFVGLTVRGRGGLVPAIYSIRVRLGNISMQDFADRYTPGNAPGDVVVMDDFFYGEPQ